MKVEAVIGANFGDEGKGLATDYLASKTPKAEGRPVVVLTNGGAQRAHTVKVNNMRHVFRHLGSGAFSGADTFIPDTFIINPVIFRQEYKEMWDIFGGLDGDIYVSNNCMFTTVFDMLVNQAREIDRQGKKHGSCGLGVFETLCRYQSDLIQIKEKTIPKFAVTAGEFHRMSWLERLNFLETLRNYYIEKRINDVKIANFDPIFEKVLKSDQVIRNFIDDFEYFERHVTWVNEPADVLHYHSHIIFENGQGLLLDQDNMDYFPHLTPSHTGLHNIANILEQIGYQGQVDLYYVTRTYMTRHGAGRFDTECPKENISKDMRYDKTNVPNPFQDTLRYGTLIFDQLIDRVIGDIESETGRNLIVTPHIFLTHCDELYYTNLTRSNFMVDISHLSFGPNRSDVVTTTVVDNHKK